MKNLFKDYEIKTEKSKNCNQRQDLVKQFLDRLNQERQGTKYKPLTARGVACKIGHVPTNELHQFYKKCDKYKGEFSRAFFGILKV